MGSNKAAGVRRSGEHKTLWAAATAALPVHPILQRILQHWKTTDMG